jgi:thiamine-phosphate pyrophosphorylase
MKSYLITDPAYYQDQESFRSYLQTIFKKEPDYLALRDKSVAEISGLAEIFLEEAARYALHRTILNQHLETAKSLGFYGVHLTSQQFDKIGDAKKAGLFTIVSTHTLEEALAAEGEGADAVTISPIFASPGKGEGRGLVFLCEACQTLKHAKVFALGGIVTAKDIEAVSLCKPYGFASIRYFV